MFNQKVNGNTSENPEYLNYSYSSPYVKPIDVHNCGTTINKYTKIEKNGSLPLQTWCSKYVAVESFAMRPIVNSKEYFDSVKSFLASIIYTDSIDLKKSNLSADKYNYIDNYSSEPTNSFLQMIQLEVTDKLNFLMAESSNQIDIFKNFNPICEGFIIIDMDIDTYQSSSNKSHFFHKLNFAAMNTTRYNTVSFKADVYQDTTPAMDDWNKIINLIQTSKDLQQPKSSTLVYVANIGLLNDTNCVLGIENECELKGYSFSNSKLLNVNDLKEPTEIDWLAYQSLSDNNFNDNGLYENNGKNKIIDTGPSNFDELIKSF